MVPAFDNAIFTQKIGDIAIVKSNFGYHIVQVEERQSAHTKPLSEVQADILAALERQESAVAQQSYAETLTSEAIKNGMEKTAAAHHLRSRDHATRWAQRRRSPHYPTARSFSPRPSLRNRVIRRSPHPPARATQFSRSLASRPPMRLRLPIGSPTFSTTIATRCCRPC